VLPRKPRFVPERGLTAGAGDGASHLRLPAILTADTAERSLRHKGTSRKTKKDNALLFRQARTYSTKLDMSRGRVKEKSQDDRRGLVSVGRELLTCPGELGEEAHLSIIGKIENSC
jgi:hypothetical protein